MKTWTVERVINGEVVKIPVRATNGAQAARLADDWAARERTTR